MTLRNAASFATDAASGAARIAAHNTAATGAFGAACIAANANVFAYADASAVRAAAADALADAALFDSGFAALADWQAIKNGQTTDQLSERKLWPEAPPQLILDLWIRMKRVLLTWDEDWEVWTDWYEDRLAGESSNEALEIARVMIPNEIWRQGPKVVNAEIKRLIVEHTKRLEIAEPLPESGPTIQVTDKGLEVVSQPIGEGFEQDLQKSLHSRLQRLLPLLVDATHKVDNTHRELDFVVSEYRDLIASPFEKLDVASLWTVGTGLLAFRQAFANQPNAAMTEPLEPGHFALLQQAAEIHGGFILGFQQGRELTERADRARLSPEVVAQISLPTRTILSELSRAKYFVEERTRPFFAAVNEGMIVNGWETARTGYAAYVVTRNSLIAIGKVLLRANSLLATVAGSIVLNSVDPNLAMTKHIILFTLEHAQTIASFVEPFPELKIWFRSIIDHLDKCDPKPRRKD